MNKPTVGLKGKNMIFPKKVIHPKQCPKCKGTDIMGHGMVMGYGWINLDDMNVDEADEFEIFDEENLEYHCRNDNCGYSWDLTNLNFRRSFYESSLQNHKEKR